MKKILFCLLLLLTLTAADCKGNNHAHGTSDYDYSSRGEEWTHQDIRKMQVDLAVIKAQNIRIEKKIDEMAKTK